MLKKAIIDITSLKINGPTKYQYGLKLEEQTLKWLSTIGVNVFPLMKLNIYKREISSLSYYLGILLDIKEIHRETLRILTDWDEKQVSVITISEALDVNDRLLLYPQWQEKATRNIQKAYLYLMRDFVQDSGEIIATMNVISILKTSNWVEINPTIKEKFINSAKRLGILSKDNIPYIMRLKTNNNIPSLLWK